MLYSEIVDVYERLAGTTKRLEKMKILSEFLPRLKGQEEFIYLFRGRVFPEYDSRELGVSTQILIKSISRASGKSIDEVNLSFKKLGDLGDVALELMSKTKQKAIFSNKLTVSHVFNSLGKLPEITGDNSIDKKISLISELLISANEKEAIYIVRTILADLRIGVADGVIIDGIVDHFFKGNKEISEKVKLAYDFTADYSLILKNSFIGSEQFEKLAIDTGRPINPMLAVKITSFDEAFESCGRPCAFEYKYDGFRVIISKNGEEVKIFTRRLEEVTNQFPDIISAVKQNVIAKKIILDGEAVGFDFETGKYLPFEAISQRIKRKYDIIETAKKMPTELNIFDVLFIDGKTIVHLPFIERRKILEKNIISKEKSIVLSKQIVTSNEEEASEFYNHALKFGEEGVMVKRLDAPYRPGRYVGFMAKLKPEGNDLDLVIVGGEYGTGKRAGGLTSFIVACRDGDKFLEVGRVSSGLKEKENEGGTTYTEMDKMLTPLILNEENNSVKIKSQIVVSVTYQNIQPSPTYSSGFALRFPRIIHVRPERGLNDIASLSDIQKEVKTEQKRIGKK